MSEWHVVVLVLGDGEIVEALHADTAAHVHVDRLCLTLVPLLHDQSDHLLSAAEVGSSQGVVDCMHDAVVVLLLLTTDEEHSPVEDGEGVVQLLRCSVILVSVEAAVVGGERVGLLCLAYDVGGASISFVALS